MIMMIDTIAERYGQLPSSVIAHADTFDLFICDAAMGYRRLVESRANGQDTAENYDTAELEAILKTKSRST